MYPQVLALYNQGDFKKAFGLARDSLEMQPNNIFLLNIAGALANKFHLIDEAEKFWRKAVEIKHDYAAAHNNLGTLLYQLKRHLEAEEAYQRAIAARPDDAEAHNNLGILFCDLKRYHDAEASYRRALKCRPNYAEAHNNLGLLLNDLKRYQDAEESYLRAIEYRPDFEEVHNNLGLLMRGLKRHSDAEASFLRALEIRPNYAIAHNNFGNLLCDLKRYTDAELSYLQALEARPNFTDAKWNLALLLLLTAQFSRAWPLYEIRYDAEKKGRVVFPPAVPYPQWSGESLQGRSLLVWSEQGFGDQIQFIRYLPILRKAGIKHISLVCGQPLKRLFEAAKFADSVLSEQEALDTFPHDFWTFPLSIPLHLETTLESIPASLPYIQANQSLATTWEASLPKQGMRVGLVWKGSTAHANDSYRSLPSLATLAPLWSVRDTTFISLQKGQGEDEATNPPFGQPLLHLGPDITDFADSAAIIAQLDLVICVDTATAHLAGALGKHVWVLLPSTGMDCRWLEERSDSPWYPGIMRLFRQQKEGDWSATIQEVTKALDQHQQTACYKFPIRPPVSVELQNSTHETESLEILSWLDALSLEDRAFAKALLKQCCGYLNSKAI